MQESILVSFIFAFLVIVLCYSKQKNGTRKNNSNNVARIKGSGSFSQDSDHYYGQGHGDDCGGDGGGHSGCGDSDGGGCGGGGCSSDD